jgi:hypothetical protein
MFPPIIYLMKYGCPQLCGKCELCVEAIAFGNSNEDSWKTYYAKQDAANKPEAKS